LDWILEEVQSAADIENLLAHFIPSIFWNEVNPLLASLGQISWNPNFPIPEFLKVVQNVCLEMLDLSGEDWIVM